MLRADPASFYPVNFGETFSEEATPSASYHSLQYKFKPQSAGRKHPGSLALDATNVTLQVPNAVGGQPAITFEGKWAPAQEGVDCIAVFDGVKWRIERLQGVVTNLRHIATGGKIAAGQSSPAAGPAFSEELDGTLSEPLDQPVEKQTWQHNLSQAPEAGGFSETPSLSVQPSVTPSLSQQPSPETSPSSFAGRPIAHSSPERPLKTASGLRQGSPVVEPAASAGGSPSARQPTSSVLDTSTSSSSSSDSEEDSMMQPLPSNQQVQAERPAAVQHNAELQDFEREFFENDSEDESEGGASDSSGNQSEEEAKYF